MKLTESAGLIKVRVLFQFLGNEKVPEVRNDG